MNARQKLLSQCMAAAFVGLGLATIFRVPIHITSMEQKDHKPIWKLEKHDRVYYERLAGGVMGITLFYGVMMTIAHFKKDPEKEAVVVAEQQHKE